VRRWPVIRHIRYFIALYRVNRHYEMWQSFGYLPVHANWDYAAIDEIWAGRA
jgi:hypothetical protein